MQNDFMEPGSQVFVTHGERPPKQPMPATVACVNEDGTINVCALNWIGQPMSLKNLSDKPSDGYYFSKTKEKHEEKVKVIDLHKSQEKKRGRPKK